MKGTANDEIGQFLSGLDHPLKVEAEAVRQIILSADPAIQEGIKWNSMSFRTQEWFATFHWREKKQLQFVLHLGAKTKEQSEVRTLSDPAGLLKWLAKDRCLLILRDAQDIEEKSEAIRTLIQEWIRHV